MKSRHLLVALILLAALTIAARDALSQTCDQTLSVGADVAAAIADAPNDSTICLNSGDYGVVQVDNAQRSGWVTVQPAAGATPELHAILANSSFIRMQGLTHNGGQVHDNASHHIEFLNCTFTPNDEGLGLNGLDDNPPATPQEIVVDGCNFTDVGIALWDGRLNVRGMNGVKIRNSVFEGNTSGLKSDGIMLIGNSQNTEIGPGNVFRDILQADATQGEHIDAIQVFGAGPGNRIFENYFVNGDTFIMAPDGSNTMTIENNVFDGTGLGNQYKMQLGTAASPVYRHNTMRNAGLAVDAKTTASSSTNAMVENNIFTGANSPVKTSGGGGCTNCTFTHNQFDGGSGFGDNTIIGAPTFVGGAAPTTYEGFALANGSVGENAGNDGLDTGIVVDGEPPPPPPAPEQITPGETQLEFDHDGLNTDSYWLCADVTCVGVAGSPFTMPEWEAGTFEFFIRATGPGGSTDGPTATFEVVEPTPPPPSAPSAPRVVP